ncbi:NAD-dependent epimerase/dehydratase family protein [Flavobacterium sp. IMCC34852]|uniref:NAD-dependent epimerase/dehydratase family protein n=1 Tax=Flavobacterium rivulicola TaxID=2732161 RepID=A0A7Y3R6D9_9FLAO|nr:NAD-dependent epimerase/dehydratase family protein [Flavobacterium sp. IMCC34852]NNT70768.1 NAD-dependent epimerase/dehydratase family protein [Flavobacterium sp. IMCC34852]
MILVTGGTGLVGSHLLLQLAESEAKIRAIYRNQKNIDKTKSLFRLYQKEALFNKIEWVEADIIDIPSLEIAFQNIECVYHCAALISYDPKDEDRLRKTNIEGTANIVNFCLAYNIKKLCHVSSIAALGDLKPHEKQITEETEWNPEAPHSDYAISKYGAEMEIWRGQQEGLQVVIVNPGVIFGTGFWGQGSSVFFSAVKKGFPFYTKGSTGYVGVTDVVKIMIALMQSNISGERFSIIAENLTFKEVIYTIAEKLKAKKPKTEAKPWMLAIAWRLDWFVATVFRTKRQLSKYSVNAILSDDIISNDKIKNALNFEFQSIDSVVQEVTDFR